MSTLFLYAQKYLAGWLGASATKNLNEMNEGLSDKAKELISKSFSDLPGPVVDLHTHVAGTHQCGHGCETHRFVWRPFRHPYYSTKFQTILSASGVKNLDNMDNEYVDRLVEIVSYNQKHFNWGKHLLLPLDKWYDEDGTPRDDKTGLYVPNDYVLSIARKYPHLFDAACSVNPYRKDALQELERCAAQGIRVIKWLPPAQGIDPGNPLCHRFYNKARELNMVMLIHLGNESTIQHPDANNSFGNPLLIRSALDRGVKVIAAHCASLGKSPDLDDPHKPILNNFTLFWRLFNDPRYERLLFADISSMTIFTRLGEPMTTILDHPEVHHRLVNGSDYPLPNISISVSTRILQLQGYLSSEDRQLVNEISRFNPLLFDFVLKRCLKSPNTGQKFKPEAFVIPRGLFN